MEQVGLKDLKVGDVIQQDGQEFVWIGRPAYGVGMHEDGTLQVFPLDLVNPSVHDGYIRVRKGPNWD